MKKILTGILLLTLYCRLQAQENIVPPTDSFIITGDVKKPLTVNFNKLETFKIKSLNDVTAMNHRGEVRSVIKNVKAILFKDVLDGVELITNKPKDFSSYYVECVGSDGFKVVFSWNELYNTANGDNTYIVLEKDGKKGKDIDDRVAVLIMTGPGKGHIYVKGLKEVVFKSLK